MSTVALYRGDIPREIALRDCSLPMRYPPHTAFSALYGEQGRQHGLMAARKYASSQGLQYTVIDLVIKVDAQNPLVMKPEDLPDYDFLNFGRMSTRLRSDVSGWFAEAVAGGSFPAPVERDALAASSARSAIETWPLLVDVMTKHEACRHVKVIAFEAATALASRPLTVGSIPYDHWGAIRSATCRLNPNVRVSLGLPFVDTKTR